MLTERAETRPCAARDCRKPIAPGQAYLVEGPFHIGCTSHTEPDLCDTWRCDRIAGHDGPCTWRP